MLGVPDVEFVGDEGQVKLPLTQIIGLRAVLQPGQLQLKAGDPVPQIDQPEGAVLGVDLSGGGQAQGVPVEVQAAVQVQYVATKIGSEVVYFDKQVFNAS